MANRWPRWPDCGAEVFQNFDLLGKTERCQLSSCIWLTHSCPLEIYVGTAPYRISTCRSLSPLQGVLFARTDRILLCGFHVLSIGEPDGRVGHLTKERLWHGRYYSEDKRRTRRES